MIRILLAVAALTAVLTACPDKKGDDAAAKPAAAADTAKPGAPPAKHGW